MAVRLKTKGLIFRILAARGGATFLDDIRKELAEFLSILHFRRASVLTFNYDMVIEVGVASHPLWENGSLNLVDVDDVMADLPERAIPRRTWGGDMVQLMETFKLTKLHGSLDWYSAPDDLSGATLRRAKIWHRFGATRFYEAEDLVRELPGREPFLVPPSATKGAFYRNPIMRELWRGASKALKEAERVTLVGYSIPVADLVFSGLLGDALRDREVQIEVVDPCPAPVIARLTGLGIDERLITHIHSWTEFVERYRARASGECVASLRSTDPSRANQTRISMPWGKPLLSNGRKLVPAMQTAFEIQDRREMDGSIVIDFDPAHRREFTEQSDATLKLSEVFDLVPGATRLVAKMADGTEVPVVGAWHFHADEHHTPGVTLAPAGKADYDPDRSLRAKELERPARGDAQNGPHQPQIASFMSKLGGGSANDGAIKLHKWVLMMTP